VIFVETLNSEVNDVPNSVGSGKNTFYSAMEEEEYGTSIQVLDNADNEEEEEEAGFFALFDPSVRKITIYLWIIWIGFGFAYYGIILFITRIYSVLSVICFHSL